MSLDVRRMQTQLGVATDNVFGRGTWTALFERMGAKPAMAAQLALGANVHCPRFGITGTANRLAHFLGQTAHESGGYRYMEEIWGPTDAQKRYEGRADLGNTFPGDGRRYAGRGILRITGRANYARYGIKTGLDLESHPELAAYPSIGVLTACQYWDDRGINALADADDIEAVTRKVNGGVNGLADRKTRTLLAKTVVA